MAASGEGGGKDDIKTQFMTREGTYKLMTLSEYSRPNRVSYNGQGNTPVKVSFICLNDPQGGGDRVCFNVGRELYLYPYKGVRKAADLTKPIDKRLYKGTYPTCHDFNTMTAKVDSVMLLVGFTAGQVQLIDPIKRELSKLYNEERLIDKTKVTCIRWLPGSANQFLVAHASGQMYVYNEELQCGATPATYQLFKQGEGFTVYTCKTKTTRNPLYRWVVGEGAVNEFAFSPDSTYLAVVSQDGYLRVFNYNSMELIGSMKSYFGGLLCVSWSPDGKYIAVGGEDDLVTVWSFHEKRVICRGQGHRSWVNEVAFDPYTSCFNEENNDEDDNEENIAHEAQGNHNSAVDGQLSSQRSNSKLSSDGKERTITTYRFGSVGQDTLLCLWDLTEDVLKQPVGRTRASTVISQNSLSHPPMANSVPNSQVNSLPRNATNVVDGDIHHHHHHHTSLTQKFATLALGDRKEKDHEKKDHKRNFSLGSRSAEKVSLLRSNHVKPVDTSLRLLGTPSCPRMGEVQVLEPLVCKKIAHERLTSLVFRDECIVTACQEGFVCTWGRPGKVGLTQQHSMTSPQTSGGGTVV